MSARTHRLGVLWVAMVLTAAALGVAGCAKDRASCQRGGCGSCCGGNSGGSPPASIPQGGADTGEALAAGGAWGTSLYGIPTPQGVPVYSPTYPTEPRRVAQSQEAPRRLPPIDHVASTALPYGGQKSCPVTDEPLGSMGAPVPVKLHGQVIYVCCQGCVSSVLADPNLSLAKVEAERTRR
jgi:hypothetical protein